LYLITDWFYYANKIYLTGDIDNDAPESRHIGRSLSMVPKETVSLAIKCTFAPFYKTIP